MLKLTADHLCDHWLLQPQYSSRQVNHCLLGDFGPTILVRLELVAEEARCNPRDTFDGQVAARFMLNNLKSHIQPPPQKPDGASHRRSYMHRPRRDFPDRDHDT